METLAPEPFRNGVKVNEYMQTSLPNVYACGDITAFSLLAHTAVSEAEVAVDHLLGKSRPMSYKGYSGCRLYESGDRRCREDRGGVAGRRYFVYREEKYRWHSRDVLSRRNEMGNGVCKLILSEDETLIGAHMLGNPASG